MRSLKNERIIGPEKCTARKEKRYGSLNINPEISVQKFKFSKFEKEPRIQITSFLLTVQMMDHFKRGSYSDDVGISPMLTPQESLVSS